MCDQSSNQVNGSSDGNMTEPIQQSALPSEEPARVWTRRLMLLGFWAVVVALGLPHWLWTTSIHRSELPTESMISWSEGQTCALVYPINIHLESSSLPNDQLESIAIRTEHGLNQHTQDGLYNFKVKTNLTGSTAESTPTLTVLFTEDGAAKAPTASLRSWMPVIDVFHSSVDSKADDAFAALLLHEVEQIFVDERASMHYLVRDSAYKKTDSGIVLTSGRVRALDKRTTRAFRYASTYHLTFSLFAAGATPSFWEIEKALHRYIEPLLTSLANVSNFTVDTQVQLYSSFSPSIAGPQLDPATNKWTLLHSDLSGFVNAAEWPLSPSIGSGPTVNMVLYVPKPEQSPLVLDTGGNSWIIPQWGGVQIFNPQGAQKDRLTVKDLEPAMLTFADQLASLLGIPPSPASLALRIESLKRERATSLVMSASSTLGALVRVTRNLKAIAIPPSVSKSVEDTIHHLERACHSMHKGRYQTALDHARTAEAEAEKAFFEPSMVGQVYFPDEHKVAVYVPLLGPMAVPMVMSALKELKSLRRSKVKTT